MNQGGGGGERKSGTYPLEGVEIEFFPSSHFFFVFREMTENLFILLRLVFPEFKHSPVFLAGKEREGNTVECLFVCLFVCFLLFFCFLPLQGFKGSSNPK